jgi:hypothetical protein
MEDVRADGSFLALTADVGQISGRTARSVSTILREPGKLAEQKNPQPVDRLFRSEIADSGPWSLGTRADGVQTPTRIRDLLARIFLNSEATVHTPSL